MLMFVGSLAINLLPVMGLAHVVPPIEVVFTVTIAIEKLHTRISILILIFYSDDLETTLRSQVVKSLDLIPSSRRGTCSESD